MDKKKILFVDDVELFRELEMTFFSREEFELLVARNGREALATIMSRRPDLVFLDLHMPEMNGDECCRKVKEAQTLRNIPIVMVTHGNREGDLERCRQAGCDEIVLKPISHHQITAVAKKFLDVYERTEPRYEARLRIRYGAGSTELLANYSINLSTGGLFLETIEPLPAETTLMVEFILPTSSTTIRTKARVAWVNHPELPKNNKLPTGMGLQFMNLTLAEMDAIRDYLKSESLKPYW